MPLSRSEVFSAYRMILGREPEDDAAITSKLVHESIDTLRNELLLSDEMQAFLSKASAASHSSGFADRPNSAQAAGRSDAERYVVVKELLFVSGSPAAVINAYAPSGRLKPHVLPHMKMLKDSGIAVLLVVSVGSPLELCDEEVAVAGGIIIRELAGCAFGAWARAFALEPQLFNSSLLILTNDSVISTADSCVFQTMIARVRQNPADIVALTASHEYSWHIESYFLGFKPKALSSWVFQHFVRDLRSINEHEDAMQTCEIAFTGLMQQGGLTVAATYTSSSATKPTTFDWRELVEKGFPFIAPAVLDKKFASVGERLEGFDAHWPAVLEKAGFDIKLIHAAIVATEIRADEPITRDTALIVNGARFAGTASAYPPRIAYFGPWNYDGSLGAASREVLCALRHTHLQLNVYPVEKPFGTHRPICPSVALTDFSGRPDVAIIHLDPSSWYLLADRQRQIISAAKRRIGYWAWEKGKVPMDLPAVDRIWTPCQDCDEDFKAVAAIPVDVVPYPVHLPARTVADRDACAIEHPPSYLDFAKAAEASIASLSATDEQKHILPPPPAFSFDLSRAQKFAELVPTSGIVLIPLADDLSWNGELLPEGVPADWLIFAPGSAHVAPGAIDLILNASALRPDVVLFYADDLAMDETMLDAIRLKPDFDRTLLVAQDYIGAPVIVQRQALKEIGGLNQTLGSAVIYDLVLRVADAGGTISRITKVLIGTEHKRPVAQLASRRAALATSAALSDIDLIAGEMPNQLIQRRRFAVAEHPPVTVIIPTRRTTCGSSEETYIERLLNAIAEVDWPMDRLTVMVGDDFEDEPAWATQPRPFGFRWLPTPRGSDEPFNYAAKMNFLWRTVVDEHIIFMNDDVFPHNPRWLAALAGFTIDDSVGGVGPLLYYEDGSIQHAGMFPSLRTVVHAWPGWPEAEKTYQNWAHTQREWSMVTGAIFATRRFILERVNGFDERFSLEFNDVDLCLRIRSLGYRIVYNPDARFTHIEKASRGDTISPGADVALFLSRWSHWLDRDPSSHPGYDHQRKDIVSTIAPNTWFLRPEVN